VRFEAEEALLPAPGDARVQVLGGDLVLAERRAGHRGLDQRRTDECAGLQHRASRVALAVQLAGQRLDQPALGQHSAEAAERQPIGQRQRSAPLGDQLPYPLGKRALRSRV